MIIAVPQACIIHLTGHSAFQIIYCMESAANVLKAAQPVSIYRKETVAFFPFICTVLAMTPVIWFKNIKEENRLCELCEVESPISHCPWLFRTKPSFVECPSQMILRLSSSENLRIFVYMWPQVWFLICSSVNLVQRGGKCYILLHFTFGQVLDHTDFVN